MQVAVLQEYKCPCCDGAIAFDSKTQKMKCPFCGTEFEIETLEQYSGILDNDGEDNLEWEKEAGTEWSEGEAENLNVYACNSCGGEIVGDETTAATSCPYCGNPVVMLGKLSGSLKPDLVIPFKLDKKAAKEILKNHYKGKVLLPKVFKTENKIEEIKGLYVPFWLFDADANAHIRYKATRVRYWSDSRYNYTETKYYSVIRGGDIGFDNIPVDGSTKMADDLMESLEPFNLADAVDFNTAYLAGYLADKYDVSAEDSIERANYRIKNSTAAEFRKTVNGYTTVSTEASTINLTRGSTRYALLPVWILNTSWKDQKFTFAINGQTGKIAGRLPMDKGAFASWFFGVASAASVISFVLMWLFR